MLNVSRGRTMYSVVHNLNPRVPLPGMHVVQTEGLLGMDDPYLEQMDFVRQIAQLFGGQYECMMLPYLLESGEIKRAVLAQSPNRQAMDRGREINLICSSILTLSSGGATYGQRSMGGWFGRGLQAASREIFTISKNGLSQHP